MDKYIYDDRNDLWYELQGDYYIPCLILPPEKNSLSVCGDSGTCGIWKNIAEIHIQCYLQTAGWAAYLADIDRQAQECMERLTEMK